MSEKETCELNKWIAEGVMGWRKATQVELDAQSRRDDWWIKPGGNSKNSTHMQPFLRFFTADSAAAMDVLKKCADKVGLTRHAVSLACNQGTWCVCEHPPIGNCINHAMAETPELAICL